MSMKIPRTLKPRIEMKKHGNKRVDTKAKQWELMQQKQNKFVNYFGKPLNEIAPPDGGCPIFVLKALKHVEANGRLSFVTIC